MEIVQHICMHSPAAREHAMRLLRANLNDCEVARRTGIARTTIRDWRRPRYVPRTPPAARAVCPRCGQGARAMSFAPGDYAELLGLYLGDGHVVRMGRTYRLRLFLDLRHPLIIKESSELLSRCFPHNRVSQAHPARYRMAILSVYSSHLPCLLPQHGPGKKHERPIVLERWQEAHLSSSPWRFLKGCIRSDGSSFINRTGPYEYLSYEFTNHSSEILGLFCHTLDAVGVRYRRYERQVRINRRASVALVEANVGIKR